MIPEPAAEGLRLGEIVGDEDPGRLAPERGLDGQQAQGFASHHVDRREGLVEQEHPERGGECPAEGHALALAAGQRRPARAGEGAEPEALQQLRDLTAAAGAGPVGHVLVTVRWGNSVVGWRTRATCLSRAAAAVSPLRLPGDEPARRSRTWPRLKRVSPAIDSRIVVFPAPEVPKMARRSPASESEPGLDGDRSALDGQVDLEQRRWRGAHGASIPATRARVAGAPEVGEDRQREGGHDEQEGEGERPGRPNSWKAMKIWFGSPRG